VGVVVSAEAVGGCRGERKFAEAAVEVAITKANTEKKLALMKALTV
jgi:hypothetical protein